MYAFKTPPNSPPRPATSSSAAAAVTHEEDMLDSFQLSDLFSRFGLSESDEGGEEGFLRKALNGCNNKDDLWHLATSLPKSATQVTKFDALFARFKELVQESLHLFTTQNEKSLFSKLPTSLHEALFGSNGVYYVVTARDPNNCERIFTAHTAHNVLFETHQQIKTWGSEHHEKGECTLRGLVNTCDKMDRIIAYINKYLDKKHFAELIDLMNDFKHYLSLHIKLMRVALAYKKPNTDLNAHNSPIRPESRGKELIDQWHPARAESTPQKGKIPPEMIFNNAKSSASRASSGDEGPIASRTRSAYKKLKV